MDYQSLASHPLVAIVVTATIGGALTFWFQERSWKNQKKIALREEFRRDAMAFFEHLSSLLDKRLYRSRKLCWAIKSGNSTEIENRFRDFNEFLYCWNDELNSNIAKIEVYFGRDLSRTFEKKVSSDLVWISTLLRRHVKNLEGQVPINEVEEKINRVNSEAYSLDRKMLNHIISEKFQILTNL